MKKQVENTFWVTNLSNRNVSLSDLNLTIRAFSSVNLMDNKHYNYTLEQLQKSSQVGSIFLKRSMLSVRKIAPISKDNYIPMSKNTFIPGRERSIFNIKEEHYEELQVEADTKHADEEKFAAENADLAQLDTLLQITKLKV